METIEREELKKVYPNWIDLFQKHHTMGPEIYEELFIKHTPVENLGHSRDYFLIIDDIFYTSYCMDHIIVDVELKVIARRLLSVTLYDSFQEYEAARVRGMQSVKPEDQTGLNFN